MFIQEKMLAGRKKNSTQSLGYAIFLPIFKHAATLFKKKKIMRKVMQDGAVFILFHPECAYFDRFHLLVLSFSISVQQKVPIKEYF